MAMARGEPGPWRKELDDFVRAFSGAFLFGIPLLYTMEMWWLGTHTGPGTLLLLLAIALAINFALTHYVGFKRESTFHGSLAETVDVVAVGAVASSVVLLVLNRIHPGDPLETVLGTVVVQTLPLSIGASVANKLFSPDKSREGDERPPRGVGRAILNDVSATAIGAAFIGFSVAPTEEVPMLAAALDFRHQLALVGFSLLLGYAIVFASGFSCQDPAHRGPFQTPFTETMLCYVVSLLVAFAALTFYNRPEFQGLTTSLIVQVLVLGLPATVGGAAGRLVYE
jgi:putative integral membrane protein (TIGR02587 family)